MSGRTISCLVAILALHGVGAERIARAQSPEPGTEDVVDMTEGAPKDPADVIAKDPATAKKWLTEAQVHMQKGEDAAKLGSATEAQESYRAAAAAYTKAIRASDDFTLFLPLALAYEKAGDLPSAVEHLRRLVATTGLTPDVIKKARTKLDELSLAVAVVKLKVVPEGARVSLGGKLVGVSPLERPLVLMPGTHVVSFAAVGYQPKDVTFTVDAGLDSERTIRLDRAGQSTTPGEAGPPTSAAPAPSTVPLLIGGGITVALAMVAVGTGIAALSIHGRYESSIDPQERLDLSSRGKTFALISDLSLVGAVGAAAFTTYWYVQKYRPATEVRAQRHSKAPKIEVAPWVQVDAGGVTAVGVF
jgi:hypothetical protein